MISLFLFIGCNQKAQKYNYEIEDSDDSYVMDGWSTEQKEDYYQKAGNLLQKFLLHDNYKIPTEVEFSKILREKLNISINTDKVYQIVPHHIFQTDSLDNTYSQLVIFPQEKIISFKSELPLLDKESIENYNSSDFKNLDHSKDYNNVINKLLFNPNQKEIDIWLKDEQLKEIFIFLVTDFHFYYEDRIFKYIIEELKRSPEKYKAEYIKLLF
ncbi:hypothetical protein SAMN05443633_12220 [Chryseobacterium arachidis]|uniref:Uncharacterized protein n=2 Tax=Chryseobacterium arachidis TaxID=1416778 RepID=A0A1M5MHB5_9FLAO|nr:hypothetical protein SAMN05443633_12220 [Chryseobacterium arachidis]